APEQFFANVGQRPAVKVLDQIPCSRIKLLLAELGVHPYYLVLHSSGARDRYYKNPQVRELYKLDMVEDFLRDQWRDHYADIVGKLGQQPACSFHQPFRAGDGFTVK